MWSYELHQGEIHIYSNVTQPIHCYGMMHMNIKCIDDTTESKCLIEKLYLNCKYVALMGLGILNLNKTITFLKHFFDKDI